MKNLDLQIKRFSKRKSVIDVIGPDFQFSEKQYARLEKLFLFYKTPKQIEHMLSTVAKFVYYDLTNYTGRLARLKGIPGTTEYTQMLRYGRHYKKIYKKQNVLKTSHFTNIQQYWIDNGYTKTAAIEKVKKVQQHRANLASLKTTGTSIYSCRSIEFWKYRGYSDSSAQAEVSRIQITNGLAYYKRKYPENYKALYQDRIARWLKSYNANDMELINLKKSPSIEGGLARGLTFDEAVCRYEKMVERLRAIRKLPSKISQKMCDMLFDRLGGSCYYSSNSHEYLIGRFRVDFYHKETKTVVEFYGDYYHQNPKLYEKHHVVYGITAEEKWKYDLGREDIIKSDDKVNKFIVVWESDFRKNPVECVNSIIKEIKDD